jgi:hypothetical protein
MGAYASTQLGRPIITTPRPGSGSAFSGLEPDMTTTVLGRNEIGVVAETEDGFRFYLTPCCGASAKGMEDYIGCRACYREVDSALGGIPAEAGSPGYQVVMSFGGYDIREDGPLIEVYGDGVPLEQWRRHGPGASVPARVRTRIRMR